MSDGVLRHDTRTDTIKLGSCLRRFVASQFVRCSVSFKTLANPTVTIVKLPHSATCIWLCQYCARIQRFQSI
jgi:hypothetical protein